MTPLRASNETPRGAGEFLERHTIAIGLGVLAILAVLTYLSIIAINGVPLQDPYRVMAEVPGDAPLLKDGDEVRVGGQRAGQVRKVEVGRNGGALVSMDLTEGPVGADATAKVRLRGLAGATYVEIRRGTTSRPLPDGGLIPLRRTSSGVELTDVVAGFDRDSRRAIARTLRGYGTGLEGRGRDINQALGDLAPLLEDGTPLLRAATPGEGELGGMLYELRRTVRGLGTSRGRDLQALLPAADSVFSTLAARRDDLAATLERAPRLADEARRTLPIADALLAETVPAAARLSATTGALQRALPDVNRLLAGRDNLPALSQIAKKATPVLSAAQPLVGELRPSTAALAPIAEPLGPFSAYVARYREEILLAPTGFLRWGGFSYPDGRAAGARAVRFAPIFTCVRARDPYPAPGAALRQEQPCRG
jgi:phospholipid/cholesterol/gamma-HCH transport system substrate-binding protein